MDRLHYSGQGRLSNARENVEGVSTAASRTGKRREG